MFTRLWAHYLSTDTLVDNINKYMLVCLFIIIYVLLAKQMHSNIILYLLILVVSDQNSEYWNAQSSRRLELEFDLSLVNGQMERFFFFFWIDNWFFFIQLKKTFNALMLYLYFLIKLCKWNPVSSLSLLIIRLLNRQILWYT